MTAPVLARTKGGVSDTAPVGVDINDTTAQRNTKQPDPLKGAATTSLTLTRVAPSQKGDGTTTTFPTHLAHRNIVKANLTVTVGGSATTQYTLSTDGSKITFNSAPAANAVIVITEAMAKTNVPDVKSTLKAFTTTVTKTNS